MAGGMGVLPALAAYSLTDRSTWAGLPIVESVIVAVAAFVNILSRNLGAKCCETAKVSLAISATASNENLLT